MAPNGTEGAVVTDRVFKVIVDIPDWPPLAVLCAYLPTEGHKSREYLDCLGAIGQALEDEDSATVARAKEARDAARSRDEKNRERREKEMYVRERSERKKMS